jgi:hypothetical protein
MRRLTAPQRSSSEMGPADCPQTRLASTDDKTSSSHTLTGRIWEDGMNQGTHPEDLPAEVLDDVASVVGAEVTLLGRLPGGDHVGAMRVQLAGRVVPTLGRRSRPVAACPSLSSGLAALLQQSRWRDPHLLTTTEPSPSLRAASVLPKSRKPPGTLALEECGRSAYSHQGPCGAR